MQPDYDSLNLHSTSHLPLLKKPQHITTRFLYHGPFSMNLRRLRLREGWLPSNFYPTWRFGRGSMYEFSKASSAAGYRLPSAIVNAQHVLYRVLGDLELKPSALFGNTSSLAPWKRIRWWNIAVGGYCFSFVIWCVTFITLLTLCGSQAPFTANICNAGWLGNNHPTF